MKKTPHYLRTVSALALMALPTLVACAPEEPRVEVADGATTNSDPDASSADVAVASDAATATTDADVAEADANVPFSSGPIVPPEMPRGWA